LLDPVQFQAVLDLLGHPVTYSKGGFDPKTGWTARVILRAVEAYDQARSTEYYRPGGARLIEKTVKAQSMDRARLDIALIILADHPEAPLGRRPADIEDTIKAAVDAVEEEIS
jgi:hypothetical protein